MQIWEVSKNVKTIGFYNFWDILDNRKGNLGQEFNV